MQNLDYLAAQYGQEMMVGIKDGDVKQLENNITTALNIWLPT